MLREQFIKDYKQRDNLSQATARALALGNDITAYGHNVQFVEDTMRTYSDLPALNRQTAIYPTERILVDLKERFTDKCCDGTCEVTWKPTKPAKPRLSELIKDKTSTTRAQFASYYKLLRKHGYTRKQIIETIRSI